MKKAPTVEIMVVLRLPEPEDDRVNRWINTVHTGKEAAPPFGETKPDHLDAAVTAHRGTASYVSVTFQKDGTLVPLTMKCNGETYDLVPRARK
jgi:hypothetical protein